MKRWSHPSLASISLRRLFPTASFVGCADIGVSDATECSDKATSNTLFAAIPGTRVDGAAFAEEAVRRGAPALLVQMPLPGVGVPQCVVRNVRKSYAELCEALHGYPSRRSGVVGVTGTNGKTTTAWLVRSILESSGKPTGLLGTIENSDGFDHEKSPLTTLDSRSLAGWLARMRAKGTKHAVMEVSSHALDQDRAAGVRLDVAIVTNITQDHFDYHQNHENYRASKARILNLCKKGGRVVLNLDDPGAASLRDRIPDGLSLVSIGLDNNADLTAEILEETLEGTRFILKAFGSAVETQTPLVGRHNLLNCLAAAAAALQFNVSLPNIAAGIESLAAVPGRLERVDAGQDFDVFVDYAHTDDALRRCIRFLKTLTHGRVIVVFGAGGDRDKTKRPLLGQAASEADLVIATSDNPRNENPESILDDIVTGFRGTSKQPFLHVDRAAAIRWAIQHAGAGDCVLIAGKGHETEQIIGDQRLPFDDRQVARSVLLEPATPPARWRSRLPA